MKRLLPAVGVAVACAFSAARAQDCAANVPEPRAGWTRIEVAPSADSALQPVVRLVCQGCKPEVTIILSAGPAPPSLIRVPIDDKAGLDWAKAVVDDEAQQAALLESVLSAERRASSGCIVEGRVNGVAELGGMGMIGTAFRAECRPQPGKLSGEYYSGYDGRCVYQARIVWPGGEGLDAGTGSRVVHLLRTVRWAP